MVEELRRDEADLRSRYTQLEVELAATKGDGSAASESSKILREMDNLRSRLNKSEHDVQIANSKIAEVAKLRQASEKDASEARVSTCLVSSYTANHPEIGRGEQGENSRACQEGPKSTEGGMEVSFDLFFSETDV